MGEVWDYTKYASKRTMQVWDRADRIVGLSLFGIAVLGYAGAFFSWWATDAWQFATGFFATVFLAVFLGYTFLFTVPAKTWSEGQPPPFNPVVGDCRIEELGHQPPGTSIPAHFVLRLDFWNFGPPGKFRAFLVRVEGTRQSSSRIPLAWTLESDAAIFLPTDDQHRKEDPVQVKVGFVKRAAVTRRRDSKADAWVETVNPFTFAPAYPGRENRLGNEIAPGGDGEIRLTLRIGREDTNQWIPATIILHPVGEDGLGIDCRLEAAE